LIVDPKSNILKDVGEQFSRIFPPTADLCNLPFHHTISVVQGLFRRHDWSPKELSWEGYDSSTPENLLLAHHLVKVAWFFHQQLQGYQNKVPHWVLRFSFHCLIQDPNTPVQVIVDCLLIIAIDLGCEIQDNDIKNPDKRSVYLAHLYSLSP